MEANQVYNLLPSSSAAAAAAASAARRRPIRMSLHLPSSNLRAKLTSLPKLPRLINVTADHRDLALREKKSMAPDFDDRYKSPDMNSDDQIHLSKLYAILEAVADRAEMHAIIGVQRDNWNHLFTSSINSIALAATLMAGISSFSATDGPSLAFKLSSTLLFAGATGMMMVVNKIQPSQLAEEQRNATRLWKQLHRSIETTIALLPWNSPRLNTQQIIQDFMEKVLALDKAYPLPLLPGMLEKFPAIVEPTCWWPKKQSSKKSHDDQSRNPTNRNNGWTSELEEEMRGVLRALQAKDEDEYLSFAKKLLKVNKALAVSGPVFAGVAAMASALIGAPLLGSVPAVIAVTSGALATVANTLEHSGQVGMVFELCRNCAGFYRSLQEEIEANLMERDVEERENGEMFEWKMALKLGRSLSELRDLAKYASTSKDEEIKEFAGKLF